MELIIWEGNNIMIKKKESYKIILLGLAVISFILWRLLGNISGINGYLNVDDLSSVQFAMIGESLFDKLRGILTEDPTNVPVFYLFLYGWIKIFGYIANTMRILPELCGAIFVFFVGLIGEKIGNKKMGILASVLSGTSIQLVYVSFQVRAYSMLMMFSAIAFYVFLKRTPQWKSIIVYTFILLLLSYTHFFGVLVCAGLGSIDVLNILLKKRDKKYLVSYISYGCFFMPYLILAFIRAKAKWAVFWPPVPSYRDIFSMIKNMCPGVSENWSAYIFAIVFCVYLVFVIDKIKKKQIDFLQDDIFTCFWVIFAVIVVVFIYSRYMNPESSVWVYRYFLVLFPFIILVVSYGIWKVLGYIKDKVILDKAVFVGIILFLGCVYSYTNLTYEIDHPDEIVIGSQDYEKLTEYIRDLEESNNDEILVYIEYPDRYFDGWIEYASQGGKFQLPNLCDSKDKFVNTDLSRYDTIYVVDIVYETTDEEKEYLKKTHTLVEQNCDGENFVDKYEKR